MDFCIGDDGRGTGHGATFATCGEMCIGRGGSCGSCPPTMSMHHLWKSARCRVEQQEGGVQRDVLGAEKLPMGNVAIFPS